MPAHKASILGGGSERDTVGDEIPELITRTEDFRTVYCKRFGCRPEKFEKRFFWQVMDPDIKPLAFVIRWLSPGFFRRDFECIQRIGASKSKTEILGIANRMRFDPQLNHGFFRKFVRIHISERLVKNMANRVF